MAARKNWVGIQIGLVSFLDEGVKPVLDFLQEKAKVNALLASTPTWSRGNAGRGLDFFPDHGKAEPDNLIGGAMTKIRSKYYEKTIIKDFFATDPLYQGRDFFEMIMPETQKRGLKVYPYYCETAHATLKQSNIANFIHVVEVDQYGRRAARPCLNNPDYRAWVISYYEDMIRSYPIDGICWGIERRSPLWNMAEGDVATCFCATCRRMGHERGIDVSRVIDGYNAFAEYFKRAKAKQLEDGHFVEFWRVLHEHPEVMQWEKFWVDSHKSLYHEIYGAIKWFNSKLEVGMHIWQLINTFHPFLRAQYDLRDLGRSADWTKPVVYNDVAGYRFNRIVLSYTQSFLGDVDPNQATDLLYKILQLKEAPWADLPKAGFSPRYVRDEVARTAERTGKPVYPGIGVGVQGVGKDSKSITPESIRAAVRAAYEGGASGICISRNYSEAMLANVAAVGDEIESLGIGETIPDGVVKVKPKTSTAGAESGGGADKVF
jgi:hypothetical protein